PIVDNYIWIHRPLELVLGIWLLSCRSKKTAWLAALLCFALFSVVPLYKSTTGAVSCGCFGSVYTNPRITLLAIYLPAMIALLMFRPGREKLSARPSILRFTAIFAVGLIILGIATPVLAFNEPAGVTCSYEVLKPKTRVGKELSILEYIDIAESLKEGNRLVLLYHYDCPDCIETIPEYEQMARDLTGDKASAINISLCSSTDCQPFSLNVESR
ncbi:MAG: MauE/DoxX family redox-associated membrane protein, partial [Planctomycetota bacterium]